MNTHCEGLGPAQERQLLGRTLATWHHEQRRFGVALAPDLAVSDRLLALLTQGKPGKAVVSATSFAEVIPLAGSLDLHSGAQEPKAIDPEERALPPLNLESGPIEIRVANAWATPVAHWLQLLWANLLGLGPQLWGSLIGSGPGAIYRLLRMLLRARSLDMYRLAAAATQREKGATIHPTATVEGCFLHENARVGAGAVVRGCILGPGAVVEELALVEGCVLGAGARVQRMAGAKFSVLEEGSAHAGYIQLGVLGKGAVVKHGAALMDMALGQKVRVRVGEKLVVAPFGLAGVCVGPGAVVGQGIKIAPGRVVPAGVTILPSTSEVLTSLNLPDGVQRARVEGNRLVAES